MAQFPARMITNKVRLSAAQVFFQPEGSEKLFNLGDGQEFVYTPDIQEWENYSRQHGTKQLIGTYPIQKGGNITFSTLSWTEIVYKIMYVSNGGYVNQDAAASFTKEFAAPAAGDIYKVPVKNAEITTADDGEAVDPVEWVEGTHFNFHAPSGIVEILAVPAGATKLTLKLNVPAIADADKLLKLKLLESSGLVGRIFAIATNQQGSKGEFNANSVKLLPSGGVASIGGDEGDKAEMTGRVYADENGEFGTWEAYETV